MKYKVFSVDMTNNPVIAYQDPYDDRIDAILHAEGFVEGMSNDGMKGFAYVYDTETDTVVYCEADGNALSDITVR